MKTTENLLSSLLNRERCPNKHVQKQIERFLETKTATKADINLVGIHQYMILSEFLTFSTTLILTLSVSMMRYLIVKEILLSNHKYINQ